MLRIEQLTSGYGEISVIREITTEIKKGEIVSVIGRNGVGKSTLIKTLIGLIRSKSGAIYFEDRDVTMSKPHERAQAGIGYVPQGHGVFPFLTVEENLKIGFMINNAEAEKNLDIAYMYFPHLNERRKQKAGTLSGGERAMVSFGRALVGKPKLLLLDEPSEGIQPNIVQQIGDIVQRCGNEMGLTIMLCEQHMGLIQQVSQRCLAIEKGTVVSTIIGEAIQDYNNIKRYLTI